MRTALVAAIVGLSGVSAFAGNQVHRWGRFEIAFKAGQEHKDPVRDVTLQVEFTGPDGRNITGSGFWDGGRMWRVRCSPDQTGKWIWRSRCEQDGGLDAKQGEFTCIAYTGDNPLHEHGAIRVSENGRYLAHADGTPFFWLVDTAWNGALLSTKQDWDRYLDNRVSKKFTGVQFVTTQWRTAYANAEGMVAYTGFEKIEINPAFFRRMDERIDAVNAKGLLAVPVLLWTLGRSEHVPGQLPEDEVICLARYMVARYGANHVAWLLAGDGNYFGANAERWKRIGRAVFGGQGEALDGIKPASGGQDHAPVTLHPQGMQWPWDAFLNEKWVSIFGYQSGHGDSADTLRWIYSGPPSQKWRQEPYRPIINLEPPYEDHIAYQSRQRHTAYMVRRAIYWSLLNAPTAGSSYGAHGVWSWETSPKEPQEHGGTGVAQPWHKAMDLPGSLQMKYMAELFTSIRWWELRPDSTFIETPQITSVQPRLTHVVYSRDSTGRATMYLDGQQQANAKVKGDLAHWDADYRLALAKDTGQRNFTLGQVGGAYDVRLRTTVTSLNGEPSLSSPAGDDPPRADHISASRSEGGDLAVIYFPVGGEIKVKPGPLTNGLKAEWFDPRSGERTPAQSQQAYAFRTPDEQDWVLLFHGNH